MHCGTLEKSPLSGLLRFVMNSEEVYRKKFDYILGN